MPEVFDEVSIEPHFKIIQENHKIFLHKQDAQALQSIVGPEASTPIVQDYITKICSFHGTDETTIAMQADITGPTTGEKLKAGMFATMVGGMVAGGTFLGEQKAGSKDLFGIGTAAQAGFASVIGESVGAVVYKGWEECKEKPSQAQLKKLEEAMNKDGFSKKYNELAEGLVKLFHFRECLLLDLDDDKHGKMRDLYITRYFKDKSQFDLNAFKIAIEVFFLQELERFFNNAFDKIYELHQQEIEDDETRNAFVKWFDSQFKSTQKKRSRFTQQMQLQFMNQCLGFLESELEEKSVIGRFPKITSSLIGFTAACVVLGVLAALVPVIPVIGLIGIGIVVLALAAVGTYFAITKIDKLYFKRDKENRAAIKNDIQHVGARRDQLKKMVDRVTQTTVKEITELKKYEKQDKKTLATFFGFKEQKNIVMGGWRAWYREYKKRFIENEIVEEDLKGVIKQIILDSQKQTSAIQAELLDYMTHSGDSHSKLATKSHGEKDLALLKKFIQDTQEYLKGPENADYKRTFELVQKIKEQILEIVAALPLTPEQIAEFANPPQPPHQAQHPIPPLPDFLVKFYTAPIAEGGLAGLAYELDQVRAFAPVVTQASGSSTDHFAEQNLMNTALAINNRLTSDPNRSYILQGNTDYRKLLGLSTYLSDDAPPLSPSTIEDYLKASFAFLCSLNNYEHNTSWDKPVQNTSEFILYRMLLLTQLANLSDPANTSVDDDVQSKIKEFVQENLTYNPDLAFDDITNQSILIHLEPEKANDRADLIENEIGSQSKLSNLSYVTEAIRVDMAYVSTELTRQDLIYFAARNFSKEKVGDASKKKENKIILGYSERLTPQNSSEFFRKVNKAIDDTTLFLETIKTQELLQQTKTLDSYNRILVEEVKLLKSGIEKLRLILTQRNHLSEDQMSELQLTEKDLDLFIQSLPAIETLAPPPPPPPSGAKKSEVTTSVTGGKKSEEPSPETTTVTTSVVPGTNTSVIETNVDGASSEGGAKKRESLPKPEKDEAHLHPESAEGHHGVVDALKGVEHELADLVHRDHVKRDSDNVHDQNHHKNDVNSTHDPEAGEMFEFDSDAVMDECDREAEEKLRKCSEASSPAGSLQHSVDPLKEEVHTPNKPIEGRAAEDRATGTHEGVSHASDSHSIAPPVPVESLQPSIQAPSRDNSVVPSPAISRKIPPNTGLGFFSGLNHKKLEPTEVLNSFIQELDEFISNEEKKVATESQSKHTLFGTKPIQRDEVASGHNHSREVKISAATILKEAIALLKQGEKPNWSPQAKKLTQVKDGKDKFLTAESVYEGGTANSTLNAIIVKHLKWLNQRDLATLFKADLLLVTSKTDMTTEL